MKHVKLLAILTFTVLFLSTLGTASQTEDGMENGARSLSSRRPRHCKVKKGNGNQVNNKCDRSTTNIPACSCKEVCKVWGDPYVAPFYSDCYVKALKTKGHVYSLWKVPSVSLQREEFEVSAYVDGSEYLGGPTGKSAEWMMEVYISGNRPITAKDCRDRGYKDMDIISKVEKTLRSDIAIEEGFHFPNKEAGDVVAEVIVRCRKSNGPQKNVDHLSVEINVHDYGSRYQVNGELEKPGGVAPSSDDRIKSEESDFWEGTSMSTSIRSGYKPPESTHYFSSDTGVCTNPVEFGDATPGEPDDGDVEHNLICRKSNTGFDVRECTCKSQCAMFGDPWVYDFFSPHFPDKKLIPPALKRAARPFKIDRSDRLQYFEKTMFSFLDHISVGFNVNNCEHIDQVTVYELLPQFLPNTCERVAPKTREFEDYKNSTTYTAAQVCKDDPTAEKVLDKITLGRIATSRDKSSSYFLKKAGDTEYCAKVEKLDLDSEVDLGTLEITLKCQETIGGEKFFNVCINLDDSTRKYYVSKRRTFDPSVIQLPEGDYDPTFFKALQGIHRSGRTAGWCASGDYQRKKGPKIERDYEFREVKDVIRFPNLDYVGPK